MIKILFLLLMVCYVASGYAQMALIGDGEIEKRVIKGSIVVDKPRIARKPPKELKTNDVCIDLLKRSEGLRLEAYLGPGGHWLIGYGHKAEAKKGMKISLQQAQRYLHEDIKKKEANVSRLLRVNVTENEFSALVCLVYNIGWGNLRKSTVLKQINKKNWQAAADAFLLWNKIGVKVSSHLSSRRKAERTLFLTQ